MAEKKPRWWNGKAAPVMTGVETKEQKRAAAERLGRAKGAAARRSTKPSAQPPTFDDWEREERRRGRA